MSDPIPKFIFRPGIGISNQLTISLQPFIIYYGKFKGQYDFDHHRYILNRQDYESLIKYLQERIADDQATILQTNKENIEPLKLFGPRRQQRANTKLLVVFFESYITIETQKTDISNSFETGTEIGDNTKVNDKSEILLNKVHSDSVTNGSLEESGLDRSPDSLRCETISISSNKEPIKKASSNHYESHVINNKSRLEQYLLSCLESISLRFINSKSLNLSRYFSVPLCSINDVSDTPASIIQIAQFLNQIDIMYEKLTSVMEDGYPSFKYLEPYCLLINDETSKDMETGLLIPLSGGIKRIFPGLTGFHDVQYLKYTNPNIIHGIHTINLYMQKFMSFKCYHEQMENCYGIFSYNIGQSKIVTSEMLTNISAQLLQLIVPYVVKIVEADYCNVHRLQITVQDMLTEDELKLFQSEIIDYLNICGPFVIADFIGSTHIHATMQMKQKISPYQLITYFVFRQACKEEAAGHIRQLLLGSDKHIFQNLDTNGVEN